ncbi:cullin-7-like [Mobula birostris]|uniref:cullin-7-like n=1 Tax=Mobula birostris TaxID=1983395 RepID=UPI003B287136
MYRVQVGENVWRRHVDQVLDVQVENTTTSCPDSLDIEANTPDVTISASPADKPVISAEDPLDVKRFLDGAWNSPNFVERYRDIYLKLKNAMEELFGQQTAFVLALRKGFSAAFLQLSHLTAMHVSEQFAQYIDRRIQESEMNISNVETLNQLQQVLEPMLFLSGLELANTFEHFYRYYLADRLLAQGKVWLERAVIDHIGTCFPSRYPQQMLKNLTESNDLQQEFHLYRLQQLDRKLESLDDEVSCCVSN